MDDAVKVVVYIIVGATVIALVQSGNTASTISSITGGFASIINAMTGKSTTGTVQQSAQVSPFAAPSHF